MKLGRVVVWQRDACPPHVVNAVREAMEIAKDKGGAVSTNDISIPARKPSEAKPVTTAIVMPRDEHGRMVIVSQGMRMSLRQYVRMAINNQVRYDELRLKEGNGS